MIENKWIVVAAADHGVVEEGVSAYPQAVTAQMVANFLGGGAAVSALARQANANVKIVDAGVANPVPGDTSDLVDHKLSNGTKNFALGPAMTREHAVEILSRGIELALDLAEQGADLIAVREMGIGNTTAASAITSVILNESPKTVTGHGTGIDEVTRLKKAYVVSKAISVNNPDATKPVDVLAKVGGYEIGFLAGVILGAAKARTLVVLDGFISTSAALLAATIAPTSVEYMLASHKSVEPGHILALEHLGLKPAIDLDMRLGEASGGHCRSRSLSRRCAYTTSWRPSKRPRFRVKKRRVARSRSAIEVASRCIQATHNRSSAVWKRTRLAPVEVRTDVFSVGRSADRCRSCRGVRSLR